MSTSRSLLTLLLIFALSTSLGARLDERPPNIVLFLVDDMGWQDTSVPFHAERTPFNDLYRTPAMERLAESGVRFAQAYACPLCSPTRTSILTGQNAARHRVTQWTLRPGKDPSQHAAGMQSPPWRVDGWQPGTPTLPGLLRERGYRTIHVGKAHFGAKGTPGEDPRTLGFDVNVAGHAAGGPGSHHGDRDFSAAWRQGDRIWDVPGLEEYCGKEVELAQALTIEALRSVEEAVTREQPFFLYMSHYAVHAPLEPDRRFVQAYRDMEGLDPQEAVYASMIEGMDASLGAILDRLGELGVARETIVLFLSDNGGLAHGPRGRTPMGTGHYTHNRPLRSGKCSAYEGGVRVPMIVSWAERDADCALQRRIPIEPGSISHGLVLIDDVLPTLCGWAGMDDLEARGMPLDGFDVTGLVTGRPSSDRPGPLVFHYPHFINYGAGTIQHGYGPFSAIRAGRFKAIYFYDREKWELYDLAADIGEEHDLAAAEPERLAGLADELVERLEAMDAQYPVVTATGQQARIRPPAAPPEPLPPLPSPQQLAWQELEFYAFVHFNMNTFTGAEWGHGTEGPEAFHPTALDCRQWARLASEAGMTAIILTVKHHDGFCLWPSAYTEHDVASSGWKEGRGDVLAELSAACAEYGLRLGVYMSPWDRNHPDYGNSPVYNEFFERQLGETLSGYGPVFEVWFDGACGEGPNGRRQVYDWDGFRDVVRELQPEAVIFHGNRPDLRWVGNEAGYAGETNWSMFRGEDYIAGSGEKPAELNRGHRDGTHWIPAECDVSIRPGWYYHAEQDDRVKSLEQLMDIYYGSVGRNANLLLNLPVDRRGLVHENDAARLLEMGALIRATFDRDLAEGARASASSVRGGWRFAPGRGLDGATDAYWAAEDGVLAADLELELEPPVVFNRVLIQEPIALGQRVARFRVEARSEGEWREIGAGTTIGYQRILRTEPIRADRVRLSIEDSRACPLISRLALFAAPPRVLIAAGDRDFLGGTRVVLEADLPGASVRYTLDGSRPTEASTLYEGPFELSRTCTLTALAFAPENPGRIPAVARFRAWSRDGLREGIAAPGTALPGLELACYEAGWQTLDQLADRESTSTAVVERIDLAARTRDEHFALVFEGFLRAPADGIYAFWTRSDDGSRLYVGGERIVENDGLHGMVEASGRIGLRAGLHPIRIEYFNATGGLGLEVRWQGPDFSRREIPPGSLIRF